MGEERISLIANAFKLEGLLHSVSGEKATVITHPHPLYGGSMHNNVAESLMRAYLSAGYSTLRFNFRGVGRSQGEYDQGRGEQQDAASAIRHLSEMGKKVIALAGYSFGAWVNALIAPSQKDVQQMILISPPVAFLSFAEVTALPQLELVVAGSRDQIAPPDLIRTMLPNWNPGARLHVIEGADHFYGGYTDELESIIAEHINMNR